MGQRERGGFSRVVWMQSARVGWRQEGRRASQQHSLWQGAPGTSHPRAEHACVPEGLTSCAARPTKSSFSLVQPKILPSSASPKNLRGCSIVILGSCSASRTVCSGAGVG